MEFADYLPLSEKVDEIRLLRLLRGSFDSAIQIQLFHLPLQDAKYTALSYCWGQSISNRVEITVDYNDRLDVLSVGENLGAALNHIRNVDEDLILWVDAICINQNDLEERILQVQLMGSIFESCEEVIAWLGPGTPASDRTMITLQEIVDELRGPLNDLLYSHSVAKFFTHTMSNLIPFGFVTDEINDHSELDQNCDCRNLDYRTLFGILNGSNSLFVDSKDLWNRDWWSRIWIIQEYLLAQDVVFVCGHYRFSNSDFNLASIVCDLFQTVVAWHGTAGRMQTMYQSLVEVDTGESIQMRRSPMLMFKRAIFEQNVLTAVMEANQQDFKFDGSSRGATDPRDRIYALLGVAQESSIRPDYSAEVEDLYIRFSKSAFRLGGFSLMAFLRPSKNKLTLPSWCLDLTALHVVLGVQSRTISRRLWASNPVTGFHPEFNSAVSNASVMTVSGRSLGRILFVTHVAQFLRKESLPDDTLPACQVHPNRESSEEFDDLCCTWVFELFYVMASVVDAEFLSIDATCSVLTGRIGSEQRSRAPASASVKTCNDFFSWVILDKDTDREKSGSELHDDVRSIVALYSGNKRIAVTDGYHAGYVDEDAQQGDLAVIIYGCPHPLILREATDVKDNDKKLFRVVGAAHFGTLKGPDFAQADGKTERFSLV